METGFFVAFYSLQNPSLTNHSIIRSPIFNVHFLDSKHCIKMKLVSQVREVTLIFIYSFKNQNVAMRKIRRLVRVRTKESIGIIQLYMELSPSSRACIRKVQVKRMTSGLCLLYNKKKYYISY